LHGCTKVNLKTELHEKLDSQNILTLRIHKNSLYVTTLYNLLSALRRFRVETIHNLEDSRNLFRPRHALSDVFNWRLFSRMSLKSQILVAMSVSLKYPHIQMFNIVRLEPHEVPLLLHF